MDQLEEKTTAAAQQAAVADGPDVVPPSYVYAIGRVEPRFPRLSVEKEFAQVTDRHCRAQRPSSPAKGSQREAESLSCAPTMLGADD
jgi:hypothetical protein